MPEIRVAEPPIFFPGPVLEFCTLLQFPWQTVPFSFSFLCWMLRSSHTPLIDLFANCRVFVDMSWELAKPWASPTYFHSPVLLLDIISVTSFFFFFWRYSGRGLFLDPPTMCIKSETCNVSLPQSMQHYPRTSGDTCQWLVFDMSDEIPYGFIFNLLLH